MRLGDNLLDRMENLFLNLGVIIAVLHSSGIECVSIKVRNRIESGNASVCSV